jgi:hypothetical protein
MITLVVFQTAQLSSQINSDFLPLWPAFSLSKLSQGSRAGQNIGHAAGKPADTQAFQDGAMLILYITLRSSCGFVLIASTCKGHLYRGVIRPPVAGAA